MIKKCTIQTFVDDTWRDAAMLTLSGAEQQGWAASTYGGYLLEHILAWQGRRDPHACSYHWPVDAEVREWPTWPAFLMDLLPQGFGRQELLRQLGHPLSTSNWNGAVKGIEDDTGRIQHIDRRFPSDHPRNRAWQRQSNILGTVEKLLAPFGLSLGVVARRRG